MANVAIVSKEPHFGVYKWKEKYIVKNSKQKKLNYFADFVAKILEILDNP